MREGLREVIPLVWSEDLPEVTLPAGAHYDVKILPYALDRQRFESGFLLFEIEALNVGGLITTMTLRKRPLGISFDSFTFSNTEYVKFERYISFSIPSFNHSLIPFKDFFGNEISVFLFSLGEMKVRNARLSLIPTQIDLSRLSIRYIFESFTVPAGGNVWREILLLKLKSCCLGCSIYRFEIVLPTEVKLEQTTVDDQDILLSGAPGETLIRVSKTYYGADIFVSRNIKFNFISTATVDKTVTVRLVVG